MWWCGGCAGGAEASAPAVAATIVPAPPMPTLKDLLGSDQGKPRSSAVPGADLSIIKQVLHELMADPGVVAERVDLTTQGGFVTVSGVVANPLIARRAIDAAERVAGVLGVVNEIEIRPPPHPDHELEEDVRLVLRTHPATAARKLEVSVTDGVIKLKGNVTSLAEKRLAEAAVLAVSGVRGIDGNLRVVRDPPRSDDAIRSDVEQRLRFDARVDARNVQVRVVNTVIGVAGSVGSAAERTRMGEDAEVEGATAVDLRGLHVDPQPRNAAPRPAPSDVELALAVQAAIDHDPRIGNGEVGSFVGGGSVKLHGRVDSVAARAAAEQSTAGVFGVRQVVNEIEVRPRQRTTDAELKRAVRRRLRAHPDVDATNLEVIVNGRAASLRGPVHNEFERAQVLEAAANVCGVVSVVDELRVLTPRPGRAADAQLRRQIASRIEADRSSAVRELAVEVQEGVVTLKGRVSDARTEERVLAAASAAGARRIVNELEVETRAAAR